MKPKTITISNFLTPDEIKTCADKYIRDKSAAGVGFANWVKTEVIDPNIARINKHLGQENDPMYLAYCVEYVMSMNYNN